MRISYPEDIEQSNQGARVNATPVKGATASVWNFFGVTAPSMSLVDQVIFTDNLSAMLEVGLPLYEALDIMKQETKRSGVSRMISHMQEMLRSGTTLSIAMGHYKKVFSPIVVSAVEVGEASGSLVAVLKRVSLALQKEVDLKQQIISALWYPAFVLVVMMAVAIALMNMVVPSLIGLFESSAAVLPWQTRVFIDGYRFLVDYQVLIWAGVLATMVAAWVLSKIDVLRRWCGVAVLRTPVIGDLWTQIMVVRFTQNFRVLLTSGLPIIEAFSLLEHTAHALVYRNFLQQAGGALQRGIPLYRALDQPIELFPPMALRMMAIGERSGMIDMVLEKLSIFYEKKIDRSLIMLTALLSPLLTIVIGLAVGFVALSVIAPIYQLIGTY